MAYNIDEVNNLIKEFEVDAVIATNSSTLKYLGYDVWMNDLKEWMFRPGGSEIGISGSFCIISLGDKPVFIIPSSFLSFLPDIDTENIFVYESFFCASDEAGKIILKNMKDSKISNILRGKIFDNYVEALAHALKEKFKPGSIFAIESDFEIRKLIEEINKINSSFKFKNSWEIFRLARMIKSDEEIELITRCLKITENALLKSINNIKPGLTFNEAGSYFKEYLFKEDAQFQYYTIFPKGLGIINYEDYELENNSVFALDVGARYKNYVSDTGLTVFCGNIPSQDYEDYRKGLSIMEAGVEKIKPGSYCSDIYDAMKKKASNPGFGDMLYEGHGIGLSFREYPVINKGLDYTYNDGFSKRSANFILQENMVFNLEISWFCFYHKTIQIEKTFFVTKNGFKSPDFQQRSSPVVI